MITNFKTKIAVMVASSSALRVHGVPGGASEGGSFVNTYEHFWDEDCFFSLTTIHSRYVDLGNNKYCETMDGIGGSHLSYYVCHSEVATVAHYWLCTDSNCNDCGSDVAYWSMYRDGLKDGQCSRLEEPMLGVDHHVRPTDMNIDPCHGVTASEQFKISLYEDENCLDHMADSTIDIVYRRDNLVCTTHSDGRSERWEFSCVDGVESRFSSTKCLDAMCEECLEDETGVVIMLSKFEEGACSTLKVGDDYLHFFVRELDYGFCEDPTESPTIAPTEFEEIYTAGSQSLTAVSVSILSMLLAFLLVK
jgi:hypothetical protein